MNKNNHGQNTFSGINAQATAAMSLFLQFLCDPKFSHIHLEAAGFQDFNLVFEDGRKIICESKNWERPLGYSDLENILSSLTARTTVSSEDQILIICRKVNKKLHSAVNYTKHFETKFKKKSDATFPIEILPQVKFWEVDTNDPTFRKEVDYLFADLIDFWLPPSDIQKVISDILIDKIYRGSAEGAIYKKTEIVEAIKHLATEAKKNSVYFTEYERRDKQFTELETALTDPKHVTWTIEKELSAFSADYERLKFAANKLLGKRDSLNLTQWKPLWQLSRLYYFISDIFKIFENNLQTEENCQYILEYIQEKVDSPRNFYHDDFLIFYVVKIFIKILDRYTNFNDLDKIFEIIKKLVTNNNQSSFFYLISRSNNEYKAQSEREEIGKLLHMLYMRADNTLKRKIFDLLVMHFDLVRDNSKFYLYSPKQIFEIIRLWLSEDFSNRFEEVINAILEQHDRVYSQFGEKTKFDGYEAFMSSSTWSGDNYYMPDQHYIVSILEPAITAYYENDPIECWQFIKDRCLSKQNEVNRKKPDFLNRAIYKIVLSRYADEDSIISEEAFHILQDFVLSQKGMPRKADLLYQAIIKDISMAAEKKWRLIEIATQEKDDFFINPFIEQAVATLARNGFQQAKDQIEKWFSGQEYFKRNMFGQDAIRTIRAFMDVDFAFACILFQKLLANEDFKAGRISDLSPFYLAGLLYDIFKRNYSKGLEIIRSLENEKSLRTNQQLIYCLSLFNYSGNDESDDTELLLRIYQDIVDPFLNVMSNNISHICERITQSQAREGFVKYAIRLVSKKKISEALRIVKIFINDPNPAIESERILKGEEPCTIASVRGLCGWALMNCCTLEGRSYLPDMIKLTEQLLNDERYYVIDMACRSLARLADCRLKVLPTDNSILFFNDNMEQALIMAKEVERIAFDLFSRFSAWDKPVQKALANSVINVFNVIRALNEKDALHLVKAIILMPIEVIEKAAGLLVYFAELRKERYLGWKFKMPGFYDDLGFEQYDASEFKKILVETIKKIQKENPDRCFQFASEIGFLAREPAKFNCSIESMFQYLELLTDVYSQNVFDLIYQLIEDQLAEPGQNKYSEQWYKLFTKCLGVEKRYYENEISKNNDATRMYWYPSLHTQKILEQIYKSLDTSLFIKAVEEYFSFPDKVELHEDKSLIDIIVQLLPDNNPCSKDANRIMQRLINRRPGSYIQYRECLKQGENEKV